MSDELFEYLKGRKPGPFRPGVLLYSVRGRMLEAYWEDVPARADPVSPSLTVMRAFSDNRPVGVKLYDVQDAIRAAELREAKP